VDVHGFRAVDSQPDEPILPSVKKVGPGEDTVQPKMFTGLAKFWKKGKNFLDMKERLDQNPLTSFQKKKDR
jgi:hypothetical protein